MLWEVFEQMKETRNLSFCFGLCSNEEKPRQLTAGFNYQEVLS